MVPPSPLTYYVIALASSDFLAPREAPGSPLPPQLLSWRWGFSRQDLGAACAQGSQAVAASGPPQDRAGDCAYEFMHTHMVFTSVSI